MSATSCQCHTFRVTGRVQGVGFRASACRQARQLGLTGWVRNCADGSVDGLACGNHSALATFRDWLAQGPAPAHVTATEMQPDNQSAPDTFDIR